MTYNFQLEALEKLLPAGFKKQREFFFLIQEPNIMVLFRKFEPNGQDEFYLAFTHTFFSSVKNKNGKYLIPPLLEQYPLSISTDQLKSQYSKHSTIQTFDCKLHHLSRTFAPTKANTEKKVVSILSIMRNIFTKKPSEAKANPVDITLSEGLRLLAEFSPQLSFSILAENQIFNKELITKQLAEYSDFLGSSS